MVDDKKHSGNLTLLGGRLCLDFINTLDWRGRDLPVEYINSYADVIQWAAYIKIITSAQKKKIISLAGKNKEIANEAFEKSIELRELLHTIFKSVEKGKKIKNKFLNMLNNYLHHTCSCIEIKDLTNDFELEAYVNPKDLISLLNPIVWDAVRLLTSLDRLRIKSCTDKMCGWMFLDVSKNKSRQWCDMKSCGNRAKARKFYKRKKK